MNHKRNIILITIVVLLLVVIGIGVTAAFYSTGDKQAGTNSFTSGCLNITIENESSAITLNNIYPVTDKEGLETTGYSFTVRNTCSTSANYAINLESINNTSNTLASDYIKVALSTNTSSNIITKLKDNTSITPSISGAYEAHNLHYGSIGGNTTKTFKLRLWVDNDTTKEQAGKTYTSKINVVANPEYTPDTTPEVTFIQSTSTLTGTTSASSVKYCVSDDNKCTPTTSATKSGSTFSIPLTGTKEKQIACVQLNSGKTICSNTITIPTKETLSFAQSTMTNENGYRYEGANPNNYVTFNNELWRIIGVFNVTNAETNQLENLIKLIRNDSIGRIKWDTEGANGENNWQTSDLQTILNEQYYLGENINYTYRNSSQGSVSISGKSLNETSRNMIQNVVWNLGGTDLASTAATMYGKERGTTVYRGRPTTWIGNVGLMYASDYGYAVDSISCPRTTKLNNYSSISSCKTNNWLFNSSAQWTLTPDSSDSYQAFMVEGNGDMYYYGVYFGYGVRPSIYLKSNVKIVNNGKDGSQSNPYDLVIS